jgi:hypothetical protein
LVECRLTELAHFLQLRILWPATDWDLVHDLSALYNAIHWDPIIPSS